MNFRLEGCNVWVKASVAVQVQKRRHCSAIAQHRDDVPSATYVIFIQLGPVSCLPWTPPSPPFPPTSARDHYMNYSAHHLFIKSYSINKMGSSKFACPPSVTLTGPDRARGFRHILVKIPYLAILSPSGTVPACLMDDQVGIEHHPRPLIEFEKLHFYWYSRHVCVDKVMTMNAHLYRTSFP
jgi:hypothetical protein